MSENFFKFQTATSLNTSSGFASLHTNLESQLLSKQTLNLSQDKALSSTISAVADKASLAINAAKEAISPLLQIIMRMPGHMSFISSMFEAIGAFFMPTIDLDFLNHLNLFNHDSAISSHVGLSPDHSFLSHGHLKLDPNGIHSSLHGNILGHDSVSFDLIPKNAPIFKEYNLSSSLKLSTHYLEQPKIEFLSGHGNAAKPVFEANNSNIASVDEVAPHQNFELMTSKPILSDILNKNSNLGQNLKLANNNSITNSTSSNSATTSTNSTNNTNASNNSANSSSWVGYELKLNNHTPNNLSQAGYGPSGKLPNHLDDANNIIASADTGNSSQFTPWSNSSTPIAKPLEAKALSLPVKNSVVNHNVHNLAKPDLTKTDKAPIDEAKPVSHETSTHEIHSSHNDTKNVHHVNHHATKIHSNNKASSNTSQLRSKASDNNNFNIANAQSYQIKSGDNLWNIAQSKLGNGLNWNKIYEMNRDVLGANPSLIRPGTVINMPQDMTQINQGLEAVNQAGGDIDYVVKPGDNLWDIAKNQTGDANNWGNIYHDNQSIIGQNPALIRPSQHLTLHSNLVGKNIADVNSLQPTVNPQIQNMSAPVNTTAPAAIPQATAAPVSAPVTAPSVTPSAAIGNNTVGELIKNSKVLSPNLSSGYGAAYASSMNSKSVVSPSLATDLSFDN